MSNKEGKALPKSIDKIILAAQECFYQHGYSAANVSLIGRYANISRATIYKNFDSKETLFRAVLEEHIAQNNVALSEYVSSKGDFWQDTEAFIFSRCEGLFEEIPNAIIRSELIHTCQLFCHDMLLANQYAVEEAITKRLEVEIQQGKLSLDKMNITIEDFAKVIESAPIGIALSDIDDNSANLIKHIFRIFKASSTN